MASPSPHLRRIEVGSSPTFKGLAPLQSPVVSPPPHLRRIEVGSSPATILHFIPIHDSSATGSLFGGLWFQFIFVAIFFFSDYSWHGEKVELSSFFSSPCDMHTWFWLHPQFGYPMHMLSNLQHCWRSRSWRKESLLRTRGKKRENRAGFVQNSK